MDAAGGRERARARGLTCASTSSACSRAGVAYQAGDILSKGVALFTLPLYTSYVSPAGYGYAETLLTAVILLSIVLRLGVGEAFIRFYYDDDDGARRDRIARAAVAFVLRDHDRRGARRASLLAGPLSRALLGVHDAALFDLAMLGAVGVHEPRDRLRAAARRRADRHLHARVGRRTS